MECKILFTNFTWSVLYVYKTTDVMECLEIWSIFVMTIHWLCFPVSGLKLRCLVDLVITFHVFRFYKRELVYSMMVIMIRDYDKNIGSFAFVSFSEVQYFNCEHINGLKWSDFLTVLSKSENFVITYYYSLTPFPGEIIFKI